MTPSDYKAPARERFENDEDVRWIKELAPTGGYQRMISLLDSLIDELTAEVRRETLGKVEKRVREGIKAVQEDANDAEGDELHYLLGYRRALGIVEEVIVPALRSPDTSPKA